MASDSSTGEPERRMLVQQNIDLRRKLEEEHQSYKRKLANYQEGQLKQAELVQKLQQKVFSTFLVLLDLCSSTGFTIQKALLRTGIIARTTTS